MSQFSGPQRKGALREHRKAKRAEAQDRSRETKPEDRRRYREGPPGKRYRAAEERLTETTERNKR